MAGISLVLKELLRYPMVALFTWRFETCSSGHLIFTVVVPVQPSMAEKGNSSKELGGTPRKVLICNVGSAKYSESFSIPVIEKKYQHMVFCRPISMVQKKIKLNVLCYVISVVVKFRLIFIFKKSL